MKPYCALEIGRQTATSLEEAAHEKGIVHRDAKGRATITDFGLARSTEASELTRQPIVAATRLSLGLVYSMLSPKLLPLPC